MGKKLFTILIVVSVYLTFTHAQLPNCHPQCAWKCDDPRCDAICEPVCEPPKCHTSCQEPKNAVCDVKCEKPDCQIMCPDKQCEANDCPRCLSICKQPHCVTHCQVPKPLCEAVCQEPNCDWKCHKPECPKPKCELVCENPGCRPQVECCKCQNSLITHNIALDLPVFKETEGDPRCCKCNNNGLDEIQDKNVAQELGFQQQKEGGIIDNIPSVPHQHNSIDDSDSLHSGSIVTSSKTHYSVNPVDKPVRIGPSYYEKPKTLLKRIEATK